MVHGKKYYNSNSLEVHEFGGLPYHEQNCSKSLLRVCGLFLLREPPWTTSWSSTRPILYKKYPKVLREAQGKGEKEVYMNHYRNQDLWNLAFVCHCVDIYSGYGDLEGLSYLY